MAVRHDGRANPNQLLINEDNQHDLARLHKTLVDAHREACGTTDDLLVGLQLTHSGRFSRPNEKSRPEPRILYHHPSLDARVNVDQGYPLLTDSEIREIIHDFIRAARVAQELGFEFVDVKHCHGYLGHEFLSAHTRAGDYGGSFENRTRFLREVTAGIRAQAPGLQIGVRLSAFDLVSFRPDPEATTPGRMGPGVPEKYQEWLPYRFGFGVNSENPEEFDLREPRKFLQLLSDLDIKLVNISGGSPYYNSHISGNRRFFSPPSMVFYGSVTAGNSSPLTDGASAVLLMSEERAKAEGRRPIAFIRSWAYSALDPSDQLLQGPAYAAPIALERAGLQLSDMGRVEMHEAFAAQVLSNLQAFASAAFAGRSSAAPSRSARSTRRS